MSDLCKSLSAKNESSENSNNDLSLAEQILLKDEKFRLKAFQNDTSDHVTDCKNIQHVLKKKNYIKKKRKKILIDILIKYKSKEDQQIIKNIVITLNSKKELTQNQTNWINTKDKHYFLLDFIRLYFLDCCDHKYFLMYFQRLCLLNNVDRVISEFNNYKSRILLSTENEKYLSLILNDLYERNGITKMFTSALNNHSYHVTERIISCYPYFETRKNYNIIKSKAASKQKEKLLNYLDAYFFKQAHTVHKELEKINLPIKFYEEIQQKVDEFRLKFEGNLNAFLDAGQIEHALTLVDRAILIDKNKYNILVEKKCIDTIKKYLNLNQLNEAIKLFNDFKLIDESIFQSIIEDVITNKWIEIEKLLQHQKYKEAEMKFDNSIISKETVKFNDLIINWKTFHKTKKYIKNYDFIKAKEESNKFVGLGTNPFSNILYAFIDTFIQKKTNGKIKNDQEKISILLNNSHHLLLTARAGSGKTTTLALKTAMLIDSKKITSPDHIMILAFNKKAAEEIRSRIKVKFGYKKFNNARTFHSLAYQLVRSKKKLLFDENKNGTRVLGGFIQNILKEKWNDYSDILYDFFRADYEEFNKEGLTLNKDKYIKNKKIISSLSMAGNKVNNIIEKYIADFLFEHDIYYTYDKVDLKNNSIRHVDFELFQRIAKKVVKLEIKILGITNGSKSYCVYHYDKNENKLIMKTSSNIERKYFEKSFKEKLEYSGLICTQLTKKEIYDKLQSIHIIRLTKRFTQYIQKAKQSKYDVDFLDKRINEFQYRNKKVEVFHKIANDIFRQYESMLDKEDKTDFETLLQQATQLIRITKGNCSIYIDKKPMKIKDIEWLLIDEFQDLSKLFFDLIMSILKVNNNVRLICVGDDWQAINGYAGSDLKYFINFTKLIKNSTKDYLLTNYRSDSKIVDISNNLMKRLGKKSIHKKSIEAGEVNLVYVDDFSTYHDYDNKFKFYQNINKSKLIPNTLLLSRYIKICHHIIEDNLSKYRTVAILTRTNVILGMDIKKVREKLLYCLKSKMNDEKALYVGTVHSYKGLEVDTVIILNTSDKDFPLIHPDWKYFRIFGDTIGKVLEEEQRLFYVALTRAKSQLWIVSEKASLTHYKYLCEPDQTIINTVSKQEFYYGKCLSINNQKINLLDNRPLSLDDL